MSKLDALKARRWVECKEKSKERVEIDLLVRGIEREFETLHNLYKVLTNKITGKTYDWFDTSVVNCKDVLTLAGLKFYVKDHGYSKAFFLTYIKRTSWWKPNKHKVFYCSLSYDFHAEHNRSTTYQFSIEDYKVILASIKRECELLQGGINAQWEL